MDDIKFLSLEDFFNIGKAEGKNCGRHTSVKRIGDRGILTIVNPGIGVTGLSILYVGATTVTLCPCETIYLAIESVETATPEI